MIIFECLNSKFYVKHQIEQVKTWACMKDSVAMQWYMEESLLHSSLPLTHVPCLQVWSQSKPGIIMQCWWFTSSNGIYCNLETSVVSTLDVMALCSWISKSRWFLGLWVFYFDWFLFYWFIYSWGNSWLVFAGRFPISANPNHFWRGIQGIHLGQLIQSGGQWVFVNKHWRSHHLSWAVSCLHAQTGVLLFHIMSMAFLNCTVCPNIHHAKVWASELEGTGAGCLTRQSHAGSGWCHAPSLQLICVFTN